MRPTHISIRGLKGEPVDYDLGLLTFVTGRNGEGKSRIREAIDFVLGRPVAGVSGSGGELRAAVAGDELDVTITVDADGVSRVIRRFRRVEGATFKRPALHVDGVQADEAALVAILGDVSAPAGAEWLGLSEDKLTAELARLGATTPGGAAAAWTAFAAAEDENAPPPRKGADAGVALSAARDIAKGRANEAQRALRAIEGSTARSREASAVAEVRPDEVSALAARVDSAEAEWRAAQAEADRAAALADSAAAPVLAWQRRRAELEAGVSRARAAVPQDPSPAPASAGDVVALRAAQAAAQEYLRQVGAEALVAEASEKSASAVLMTAKVHARNADSALCTLDHGRCPTCHQSVSGDVRVAFEAAADSASASEGEALARYDDARRYMDEQREELRLAQADYTKADAAVVAAEKAKDAAERHAQAVVAYRAAVANADAAQAALAAFLREPAPAAPEDARAHAISAANEAERLAVVLDELRRRHHEMLASVERYKRWREDLAARSAAEAKKKSADALLETVREAERKLATAGADALASQVALYLPAGFGEMAVVDGAIGLHKDGNLWSGPGLSSAQRLILALAIDRALDALTGRKLRLALLEVEALDDVSLDHVCAALEGDVDGGDLDAALLLSCHEPAFLTDAWTRIHVGPVAPGRGPQGGEPAEIVVSVVDETVGSFGGDPSAPVGHIIMDGGAFTPPSAGTPVVFAVAGGGQGDLTLNGAPVTCGVRIDFAEIHAERMRAAIERNADALARVIEEDIIADIVAEEMLTKAETAEIIAGMPGGILPGAYPLPVFGQHPDTAPPPVLGQPSRTGGPCPDCGFEGCPECEPSQALTPEGAQVLADIVEADAPPPGPEPPPPQVELALGGVAPKASAPMLPDVDALDDAAVRATLVDLGNFGEVRADTARAILKRRMEPDNISLVVENTAAAIRRHLPKVAVPPPGVADWLRRPTQAIPESEWEALQQRLSGATMSELRLWPGDRGGPYEGGPMADDAVAELFDRGLLVGFKLTPKGTAVWRILHPEYDPAPSSSPMKAAREESAALAESVGAGVTEAEARHAIKGMHAPALKALGAACGLPVDANMTIGKRRDEIAGRIARAGTTAAALAEAVAKFLADYPRKQLTTPAVSGDDAPETSEVEADAVS